MIEHLISTTHRLVCKILLSLRLRGTVAYIYIYTRTDRYFSIIILIIGMRLHVRMGKNRQKSFGDGGVHTRSR